MVMNKNIEDLLNKYNMPIWINDYIQEYIKSDPINALKRGVSFIEVKRKRGVVTSSYVVLPNGIKFNMSTVIYILSLFYYGEKEIEQISESWSSIVDPVHPSYIKHFVNISKLEKKHIRAIKNLMDGLTRRPEEPPESVKEVFNYIKNLSTWQQRFVALYLILRYSYSAVFGQIFYKVFYFVMPEFMRSFGKVYIDSNGDIKWGIEETKRIIKSKEISNEDVIKLSEDLLSRISVSVKGEMHLAVDADIEKEANLMLKIAIAYPLHQLKDYGVKLDINEEEEIIKKKSEEIKSSIEKEEG